MNTTSESPKKPSTVFSIIFVLICAGVVFGLGMLALSITERRAEAVKRTPSHPIGPMEMDAAKWGLDYPRQYDSWKKTSDTSFKSRYAGSGHRDYLAETPANVILFAGYGFGKDYTQGRGHWYAVEDVSNSPRVNASTPASCWYCKSPDVPRLIEELGIEKFAAHSFDDLRDKVTHAISCYDCHEENTMKLRVERPAILKGLKSMGKDPESFTHQEMRSIACAQCHSTYYFEQGTNIVTFPWSNGFAAENMEKYYLNDGFSDWTHPISKVRMIKLRHPDYELFSSSVHAFRGLSCADCHMPYRTEGAEKFSNHHLRSPLADIANTCNVCHRWGEDEVRERVYSIQGKVRQGRDLAEKAVAHAHFDIAACMEAGANDEELAQVRELLRNAQMYWDYVAAANGMGFHSPQESQRILAVSLEKASEVRLSCSKILARYGYSEEVVYPDFSSKEKAQAIWPPFQNGTAPSLLKK